MAEHLQEYLHFAFENLSQLLKYVLRAKKPFSQPAPYI